MFIINHRKIFIIISAVLVAAAITTIAVFGLKFGIEFRGGAQAVISYEGQRPEIAVLQEALAELSFGELVVQPIGEMDYSIKTRDLTEPEHQALLEAATIDGEYDAKEVSFTSIGPSIGRELKTKAVWAIILVMGAIILFIAYAFRKVSRPVSSWKYGLIAIVTLAHDIIIPTGIFALISHASGVEIDALFIVALLTVLGLSVADTIVIFDRIRENLRHHHNSETFAQTVGKSLSQSFTRSFNTSLTIILVVLSLLFFGPESTKTFALVLSIGLFLGTYSSLFLASPVLVMVERLQSKSQNKK